MSSVASMLPGFVLVAVGLVATAAVRTALARLRARPPRAPSVASLVTEAETWGRLARRQGAKARAEHDRLVVEREPPCYCGSGTAYCPAHNPP